MTAGCPSWTERDDCHPGARERTSARREELSRSHRCGGRIEARRLIFETFSDLVGRIELRTAASQLPEAVPARASTDDWFKHLIKTLAVRGIEDALRARPRLRPLLRGLFARESFTGSWSDRQCRSRQRLAHRRNFTASGPVKLLMCAFWSRASASG